MGFRSFFYGFLTFVVEENNFSLFFFYSLLNVLFLVYFDWNYGFLLYYVLWKWHHSYERLKANLGLEAWKPRARKLIGTLGKLL